MVEEAMTEAQRRGIWIHAVSLVDDLLVVAEPQKLDEAVDIVASCVLRVLQATAAAAAEAAAAVAAAAAAAIASS